MAAQLGIGVRVLVRGPVFPVYVGVIVGGPYRNWEFGDRILRARVVIEGVSWDVDPLYDNEAGKDVCSESILTPIDGDENLEEGQDTTHSKDLGVAS